MQAAPDHLGSVHLQAALGEQTPGVGVGSVQLSTPRGRAPALYLRVPPLPPICPRVVLKDLLPGPAAGRQPLPLAPPATCCCDAPEGHCPDPWAPPSLRQRQFSGPHPHTTDGQAGLEGRACPRAFVRSLTQQGDSTWTPVSTQKPVLSPPLTLQAPGVSAALLHQPLPSQVGRAARAPVKS